MESDVHGKLDFVLSQSTPTRKVFFLARMPLSGGSLGEYRDITVIAYPDKNFTQFIVDAKWIGNSWRVRNGCKLSIDILSGFDTVIGNLLLNVGVAGCTNGHLNVSVFGYSPAIFPQIEAIIFHHGPGNWDHC